MLFAGSIANLRNIKNLRKTFLFKFCAVGYTSLGYLSKDTDYHLRS